VRVGIGTDGQVLTVDAASAPGLKWSAVIPGLNIETLSATKTLVATDAEFQVFTISTNRTVNLPSTGLTAGKKFTIINGSASTSTSYLTIYSGGNIDFIYSCSSRSYMWSGSAWFYIDNNRALCLCRILF